MISGTITIRAAVPVGPDAEAFWTSVAHAPAAQHRPQLCPRRQGAAPARADLSRLAPVRVSTHPNAGLPNEFGGYDETPIMRDHGNLPGAAWSISWGLLRTTPAHIAAIGAACPRGAAALPLAGADPLAGWSAGDRSGYALRQCRRAHQRDGSRRFAKLVLEGSTRRRWKSPQQWENGAQSST